MIRLFLQEDFLRFYSHDESFMLSLLHDSHLRLYNGTDSSISIIKTIRSIALYSSIFHLLVVMIA